MFDRVAFYENSVVSLNASDREGCHGRPRYPDHSPPGHPRVETALLSVLERDFAIQAPFNR